MANAGIVIDAWKLGIFNKHLKEAGYEYEGIPTLVPYTLTLNVQFPADDIKKLQDVVAAANKECVNAERNSH